MQGSPSQVCGGGVNSSVIRDYHIMHKSVHDFCRPTFDAVWLKQDKIYNLEKSMYKKTSMNPTMTHQPPLFTHCDKSDYLNQSSKCYAQKTFLVKYQILGPPSLPTFNNILLLHQWRHSSQPIFGQKDLQKIKKGKKRGSNNDKAWSV